MHPRAPAATRECGVSQVLQSLGADRGAATVASLDARRGERAAMSLLESHWLGEGKRATAVTGGRWCGYFGR